MVLIQIFKCVRASGIIIVNVRADAWEGSYTVLMRQGEQTPREKEWLSGKRIYMGYTQSEPVAGKGSGADMSLLRGCVLRVSPALMK